MAAVLSEDAYVTELTRSWIVVQSLGAVTPT
jgi:hypothetical protein